MNSHKCPHCHGHPHEPSWVVGCFGLAPVILIGGPVVAFFVLCFLHLLVDAIKSF